MSNLIKHAENELDLIGMTADSPDEMNVMMRKHILHMMKEFADEGHSGFSANYAISLLTKLLAYKPLSSLTGEDDEWIEHDYGVPPSYQNKRKSSVFKDGKDGQAYDIDGKVFWEWFRSEDGTPYKSYYTCRDSRVPVTFPYTVPDKPEYVYRYSDADPSAPPQTEEGLL
jgi:hypothetical protein